MSSGSGYGPPTPPPKSFDCASLVERTLLNSAVEDVVKKLKIHEVLDVTLSRDQGTPIVQAVTKAGEVAGSLTPYCIAALIRCLSEGHPFIAVVLTETGGSIVRVELRSSSP